MLILISSFPQQGNFISTKVSVVKKTLVSPAMKHFQWKTCCFCHYFTLKPFILRVTLTTAITFLYYFMYNNYKLKALLADKTSDYVVISVIQGRRQKKIVSEARSTKKLRLRQCPWLNSLPRYLGCL